MEGRGKVAEWAWAASIAVCLVCLEYKMCCAVVLWRRLVEVLSWRLASSTTISLRARLSSLYPRLCRPTPPPGTTKYVTPRIKQEDKTHEKLIKIIEEKAKKCTRHKEVAVFFFTPKALAATALSIRGASDPASASFWSWLYAAHLTKFPDTVTSRPAAPRPAPPLSSRCAMMRHKQARSNSTFGITRPETPCPYTTDPDGGLRGKGSIYC